MASACLQQALAAVTPEETGRGGGEEVRVRERTEGRSPGLGEEVESLRRDPVQRTRDVALHDWSEGRCEEVWEKGTESEGRTEVSHGLLVVIPVVEPDGRTAIKRRIIRLIIKRSIGERFGASRPNEN